MDFFFQHALSSVFEHTSAPAVTEDQVQAIVTKTMQAFERRQDDKLAQMFREFEADTAVAGVGTTREPGTRPEYVVPRSEFHRRAESDDDSLGTAPSLTDKPRVRNSIETLTLVSPVLTAAKRRWKFQGKEGEFGAIIEDGLFLDNVLRGRSAVPMAAGVSLEVDLQTVENPAGGVWVPYSRKVLRVRRIIQPTILRTQRMLALTPEVEEAPDRPPNGSGENRRVGPIPISRLHASSATQVAATTTTATINRKTVQNQPLPTIRALA